MRHDPRHCLTFDIEEHFHVTAFDSPMRRRHWEQFESRVERNTMKIVELLAERKLRATFFVLGWVAQRHPALIRALADAGHEIASHGYAHELITTQSTAQFRADVRKAKGLLEDIAGCAVDGYRAPSFSIVEETRWALDVLVDEGHRYDSSIMPVVHDLYGMPGANPYCHHVMTLAGPLWEVPPSSIEVAGIRISIGGGGYVRILPNRILRWLLAKRLAENEPLVMYFHPWELDPDQPLMNGPWLSRWRHYYNLPETEERLKAVLEMGAFGPIADMLAHRTSGAEALFHEKEDVDYNRDIPTVANSQRASCI